MRIGEDPPPDYAVEFAVEATDAERLFLWAEHNKDSFLNARLMKATGSPLIGSVESWDEIGCVFRTRVKSAALDRAGVDTWVSVTYAKINNRWTVFWTSASRYADHWALREYITDRFKRAAFANAMNFHLGHGPVSGPMEELARTTSTT